MKTAMTRLSLKVLAGYQLIEKLGEGGMGVVYKARQQNTEDVVAIKLLDPDKCGTSGLKRFEQEFRAALRLDHPNIVKGRDFGSSKGAHYMVMEFVDGTSLAKRIGQAGRLPEGEAIAYLADVAVALNYVHQHDMIHRDVKPDNILLTKDNQVKLTDLGLVKVLDDQVDLTRPNTGLGTPNFMAPEQFNNAKAADLRCDVYSLGATLYAAVTGELPFRASTPLNVLKKKMNCDLAPASKLVPGLSPRIDSTIARAINLDPQRRHANCLEFIDDLVGEIRRGRDVTVSRVETKAPPPDYRGKERRKHARRPSNQEGRCLPFAADKHDQWSAHIEDVSETGIGLTLNRRFEVGTLLVLCLQHHNGPGVGRFVVRVMRREARSGRKWRHGCHFIHPISEEELQALI